MVSNPSKMISIVALVTRTNTWVPEPQGANERLDLWHGEAQHQLKFPRSFLLTYIIPNPIRVSTSGVNFEWNVKESV